MRSFMDLVPPSAIAGPEAPKPAAKAHLGVRGRPWTNVHALAKQHSVAAFEQLVELTHCDNPCVRLGASRVVLELDVGKVPAIIEHRKAPGARPAKGKHAQELKIRITHFKKEGKDSGTETAS